MGVDDRPTFSLFSVDGPADGLYGEAASKRSNDIFDPPEFITLLVKIRTLSAEADALKIEGLTLQEKRVREEIAEVTQKTFSLIGIAPAGLTPDGYSAVVKQYFVPVAEKVDALCQQDEHYRLNKFKVENHNRRRERANKVENKFTLISLLILTPIFSALTFWILLKFEPPQNTLFYVLSLIVSVAAGFIFARQAYSLLNLKNVFLAYDMTMSGGDDFENWVWRCQCTKTLPYLGEAGVTCPSCGKSMTKVAGHWSL